MSILGNIHSAGYRDYIGSLKFCLSVVRNSDFWLERNNIKCQKMFVKLTKCNRNIWTSSICIYSFLRLAAKKQVHYMQANIRNEQEINQSKIVEQHKRWENLRFQAPLSSPFLQKVSQYSLIKDHARHLQAEKISSVKEWPEHMQINKEQEPFGPTLFPKNILELLAIAPMNLSSRYCGVSFNLFASASFVVLKNNVYEEFRKSPCCYKSALLGIPLI